MPTPISIRPPFRTRGQNWFPMSKNFNLLTLTGSGGVEIGGAGGFEFQHAGQVASDIVVEWDLDNDGDFGETEEDITQYVLSLETTTGRDWPSLLQGKAGPGKFRATLDNSDDRFAYFNTASPMTQSPFSLKTGRKLRVRTSTSSNPDPAQLAKDRFGRADGSLGTPEMGTAWSGPLTDDFVIVSKQARPTTEGAEHIAVTDVAVADYYAQVRISTVGRETNVLGLVYRYQDADDYSLAVLDMRGGAELKTLGLFDVVGGSSGGTTISVEAYDDITIGVLVSSNTVTLYQDGVPVLTTTAVQTDETEVGIYALWGDLDTRPAFDDFYVWDGLMQETEGILWTGDVSELTTSVAAGPEKYAVLEGEGWLSRLGSQRLRPIRSVHGRKTGICVGNLLARANLAHPPGPVDEGDITTGSVGYEELNAIEGARRFEDVEFGFLYETQEGPLSFDSRTARDGSVVVAYFSDQSGAQFTYTEIEPLDWRREVINRVTAGVSPEVADVISIEEFDGSAVDPVIDMPTAGEEGDLQILCITAYNGSSAELKWLTPPGWKLIGGDQGEVIASSGSIFVNELTAGFNRILARVLDRNWVTGDSSQFAEGFIDDGGVNVDSYSGVVYNIRNWFGSIDDGVAISDYTAPSGIDTPGDDPPVVFPSWGPAPSVFLAFCIGILGSAGFDGNAPPGYRAYSLAAGDGTFESFTESAYRRDAVQVENPGSFNHDYGGDDGWVEQSVVVAVRGYNGGDDGAITVQLDDLDSQDDHNSIRTNTDPPEIFATEADAETYAQLVLDTYADDRPLIRLEFVPSKSGAYRSLAVRSRVGDRIALVAQNNSGLGISSDFYIENIEHRWTNGRTFWTTSWQLSPV